MSVGVSFVVGFQGRVGAALAPARRGRLAGLSTLLPLEHNASFLPAPDPAERP